MRVILISIICLMLGGCMTTGCAGWEKLTPSSGTRTYIVNNDTPFARSVAAHNENGRKNSCWK